MAKNAQITKGASVVASGPSPLVFKGAAANTDIKAGDYQLQWLNDDGKAEGPKTPIEAFKTLPIKVTGVSLGSTTASLVEGTSQTLTHTVSPSNATNKAVTFSSSNSAVATVDNSGKVVAVKAGAATITVKTTDGNKTATCAITVTAKPAG